MTNALEAALRDGLSRQPVGVELGGDQGNGLARLVLALVNIIHELLERQALRRIEGGHLTPQQVESLGTALMHQARTIAELCDRLGIDERDLAIDLGPPGGVVGVVGDE